MKYRITIDLWHPNLSKFNMTGADGAKFLKTFFDRLIAGHMAGCKWWTEVEIMEGQDE